MFHNFAREIDIDEYIKGKLRGSTALHIFFIRAERYTGGGQEGEDAARLRPPCFYGPAAPVNKFPSCSALVQKSGQKCTRSRASL